MNPGLEAGVAEKPGDVPRAAAPDFEARRAAWGEPAGYLTRQKTE